MYERQLELLEILHQTSGYATAEQLAERVRCSPQTVRNDIKELRRILEDGDWGSIDSKTNKGFCLNENEDWAYLVRVLKKEQENGLCAEESLYKICEILLKKNGVRMNDLENVILMGRTGVERYTELACRWLEKHGITVTRKRGKGLELQSSEHSWRLAMLCLFWELPKDKSELGRLGLTSRVESFLWGFDTRGVADGINAVEEQFHFHFSFDAYWQLLFLISLSVIRNRRRRTVEMSSELQYQGIGYDRRLTDCLVPMLEHYYGGTLPLEEREFILFAVSISEIQNFYDPEECFEYEKANEHVKRLVEKITVTTGNILNLDFTKDQILQDSLFYYLKSALLRLEFHLNNPNPFLKQIKTRYPNIYAAAWSAGLIIESETGNIPGENEIAYLALYFGGAAERLNVNTEVYILCNYGIGVSQILKEQVEKTIPNLTVMDIITTRQARKIQRQHCDFLISTVPVGNDFAGIPVLEVGNILQPRDIRLIQEKIRQVRKAKMKELAAEKVEREGQLFYEHLVFRFEGEIDKEELLRTICTKMIAGGYATEGLTEAVLSREQVTSTVLTNRVSIPHGMPECVLRPAIAVGILEVPVHWEEGSLVDRVFLLSLNLEEKFQVREQIINFYAALVELLDNEEEYRQFRQLNEPEAVCNYLNKWLRKNKNKN